MRSLLSQDFKCETCVSRKIVNEQTGEFICDLNREPIKGWGGCPLWASREWCQDNTVFCVTMKGEE